MILTWLTQYRDVGLLLLRIALGGFFVVAHGWPKLAGGVTRWKELGVSMKYLGISFAPQFWGFMAAFSESIGAALFVLGLFFRPACGLLGFTMAVAATMLLKTKGTLFAASQPIELCIVFLCLLLIGPGKYSFDKS